MTDTQALAVALTRGWLSGHRRKAVEEYKVWPEWMKRELDAEVREMFDQAILDEWGDW